VFLKQPGVIVACPRPIYNDADEIVGYTDPPCPLGVECINEPQDL
jgi:hypothetical protein